MDSGFGRALRQNVEGRIAVRVAARCKARGSENRFQLAGADDGVDLWDILLNLVTVAFNQAAGDDDALGLAAILLLVLDHFEDRVDRLLFGRVDEAAGVNDDDLGVFSIRRQFGSIVVEQPHHHLGVNEVLRAAKGDKAHLGTSRGRSFRVFAYADGVNCCGGDHSLIV
jgi:hypothetical protein